MGFYRPLRLKRMPLPRAHHTFHAVTGALIVIGGGTVGAAVLLFVYVVLTILAHH